MIFVARLVHVTEHALLRHLERFDGPDDREQRRFVIGIEVSAALSEGRYSTREPSFACHESQRSKGRNGREKDRSLRWCWTADECHLYLIDKTGGADVVVTSIDPTDDRDTLLPDG